MIEVQKLTKRFGKFTALQDISLTLEKGAIYGLVGYNGAGKTTLLKNISGVYKPEEGAVLFDGVNVFDNAEMKSKIFFIPDDLYFGAYANMNKMAHFYHGYYKNFKLDTFRKLTMTFGLDPNKRINGFSKGMQRQAEMVFAMSAYPDVILLDESFDGIDPQKRLLMKQLINEYIRDCGGSVMISSHNLSELEDLCTHVGIVNGKRIAVTGSVSDLSHGKSKYRLSFSREFSLSEFDGIACQNLHKDGQIATFTILGDTEEAREKIKALRPAVIERINMTLEEIFLDEMEGGEYDLSKIFNRE